MSPREGFRLLSDDEWTELAFLLVDARDGRLSQERETRLRSILAKKDAEALILPREELVYFGRMTFGAWVLTRGALGETLPTALGSA